MNAMQMMQIMQRWSLFQEDHPKFRPFLGAMKELAMKEGTVLELKATDPDGKTIMTNIKVTANDVETFRMASELMQNRQ